jgi:hypothetical protein
VVLQERVVQRVLLVAGHAVDGVAVYALLHQRRIS